MMTKQHYIKLAFAIAKIKDKTERKTVSGLIGVVLANDNPLFDWKRWNEAINK